jgi:hypothetical protein
LAKNEKDLERLKSLGNDSDSYIFGTDGDFTRENDSDLRQIKDTISGIRKNIKKNTGDDIIEFHNRVNFSSGEDKKKDKVDNENGLVDLDDLVGNPDNPIIQEIFFNESSRFDLYKNYDMIYEYIPQMAQALDTYVDNIISPDDFTKDVFNLFYDGKSINTVMESDDDYSVVIKNLKEINERYNMEEKSSELIRDSLRLGDQFVAVLRLDEEINNILNEGEQSDLFSLGSGAGARSYFSGHSLSESDIEMDERDSQILSESGLVGTPAEGESQSQFTKKEMAKFINENIDFSDNYHSLLEENNLYHKDFKKERRSKFNPNMESPKSPDAAEQEDVFLTGSVLKVLDPRRTIKLEVDEVNYGYYYIEKHNLDSLSELDSGASRLASLSSVASNLENRTSTTGVSTDDLKLKAVSDIFLKNIGKKIDKKFVARNKEFKDLIYNFLKQGYIIDKKVKITYLPPSAVVHFDMGESIYKKILFVAKLYLAVLTSQLMAKLVRSSEKRVFYIEVGLDNDAQNSVQSFVRSVKNKEFKISSLKDISTVLNYPGQFNDYYIPTINGDKPIEIDTIPGMDVDLSNDFLEYLLKAMMSGTGVPPDFLSYSEQVEFARSLAMQNGKFVRSIIHFQKKYGKYFSEIYRKLYRNEYGIVEKKKSKNAPKKSKDEDNRGDNGKTEDLKEVDYDKIVAKFPPPSSLNMTNMIEQITNSRDIIDHVVNTLLGDDSTNENLDGIKSYTRRKVAMDLTPSINWEKYEEMVEEAKREYNKSKLEKVGEDDDTESGGGYY